MSYTVTARSKFWDAVKALGIACVVIGHAGFIPLTAAIIMNYFHLGIFFFVSGALFKEKNAQDPVAYVGKKLRSIYLPTMKYVIAFILLRNVFLKLGIYCSDAAMASSDIFIYPKSHYSLGELISESFTALLTSNYSVELAGAMWMVFPLIVASVLLCLLIGVTKRIGTVRLRMIVLCILAMLCGMTGYFALQQGYRLAWRVETAFLAIPIMLVGMWYAQSEESPNPKAWGAVASMTILFLFYQDGLDVSYASGIISNFLEFYVASFCGVYCIMYAAKLIIATPLASVVTYIGQHSFDIMRCIS